MVTLIAGPMFSGKSTELYRCLERSIRGRKKVCLIRPKTDTRDFVSHSKATELIYKELKIDVFYLGEDATMIPREVLSYEVIGIDECQFIPQLRDLLARLKAKTVYMSGLLATSENELFPSIIESLPFCDEIIKLNAVCVCCGSQYGNYTYYKPGKKTAEVVVGGENLYEARCRICIDN